MSHMLGKGAKNVTVANGLQLQSSVYGLGIPIVYGTTRIGGNLGWYGDFAPHQQGSSGGKGSSSGKSGKGSGQTTYSTSFIDILCEGPINGVQAVWLSQSEGTQAGSGFTLFTGAYAQAPWSYLTSKHPRNAETYSGFAYEAIANANLGTSPTISNYNFEVFGFLSSITATYNLVVPAGGVFQVPRAVIAGTHTDSQGNTTNTTYVYYVSDGGVKYHGGAALTNVSPAAPAVGQYKVVTTGASAGTYTFNVGDAGAAVDITYTYHGDADPSLILTDLLTNTVYGVSLPATKLGTVVQANEAHTIPGTPFQITVTNAANFKYNLDVVDASGNIYTPVPLANTPAHLQYTVNLATGLYTFAAADAAANITIRYAWLDTLRAYQAFCWASELMMSPSLATQTPINTTLGDFARDTYSEWVWDSGVLTLVPRGETALSKWNFTYTPNLTPIFNLTDDDFLPNTNPIGATNASTGDDPLILARQRPVDQVNNIKVEFFDRANQYAPSIAEQTDQANIDQFRRRSSASRTSHWFCDAGMANNSAQLQLQRELVRNAFSCMLDPRYCVLSLMDPLTVQDVNVTNNVQILVRAIEIMENDDGTLSFVLEQVPNGTGGTALYNYQGGQGALVNTNSATGTVNAPIYLDVPVGAALAAGGANLETWVLVSGSTPNTYGGAVGNVSTDGGSTYFPVNNGVPVGAARMGVSTAVFPTGGDPDTTHTLSIDLTESAGTLASGTQSDADNALTLCAVMNEQAPLPPTLTQVATGTLVATVYSVRITYVYASIEGPSSLASSLAVLANNVLHIASPAAVTGATGWNVYVGPTPGAELLQNVAPIAIGTDWQEPTSGLFAGSEAPNSCLFEMLSYETANLTATSKYDLTTYLRRNQYGTPNDYHPSGEPFGRTDNTLFKVIYNRSQIGSTVNGKFQSVNSFGGGLQDISTCTAYPHVIQGPPPLPAPTGLTVSISPVNGIATISWNDLRVNPQLAPAVSGYDILYGATNLLGPVTPLALGYQGNTLVTNGIPAGSWLVYVRGIT